MAWTDRFVGRDGAHLAVREYGGEGLSLLMVHGLTHNVCAWDQVGPLLARHFRVVAFDLRGHGKTEATSDYSLAAHLEDMDAIRDTLGMGPTVLVGHSIGAIVSVAYADRRADVLGVVNVDGHIADPAEYGRELGLDREVEKRHHVEWLASEWLFQGDAHEVEGWLSEQRRGWDEWLDELDADPSHAGASAFVEPFDFEEPMLRRQLNEIGPGIYERKPSQADWARLISELLDPLWEGVSTLYERLETPLLVVVARREFPLEDVSAEQIHAVEERMLNRLRDRHPETRVEWVESSHNVPLVLPAKLSKMIADFALSLEETY
jgi:pimeloyl-ACP methyl ester carboxylesterase